MASIMARRDWITLAISSSFQLRHELEETTLNVVARLLEPIEDASESIGKLSKKLVRSPINSAMWQLMMLGALLVLMTRQ
jgi:hypothetical protein